MRKTKYILKGFLAVVMAVMFGCNVCTVRRKQW